jgi:hypothetical protein
MGTILNKSKTIYSFKTLLKVRYNGWGLIGGLSHNLGINSTLFGIELGRDYFSIILYNRFSKSDFFQPRLKFQFNPPRRRHKRHRYRTIPLSAL